MTRIWPHLSNVHAQTTDQLANTTPHSSCTHSQLSHNENCATNTVPTHYHLLLLFFCSFAFSTFVPPPSPPSISSPLPLPLFPPPCPSLYFLPPPPPSISSPCPSLYFLPPPPPSIYSPLPLPLFPPPSPSPPSICQAWQTTDQAVARQPQLASSSNQVTHGP